MIKQEDAPTALVTVVALYAFFCCGPYRCIKHFFTRRLGRWHARYFYGLHAFFIAVLLYLPDSRVRRSYRTGDLSGVMLFTTLSTALFTAYRWLHKREPGWVTATRLASLEQELQDAEALLTPHDSSGGLVCDATGRVVPEPEDSVMGVDPDEPPPGMCNRCSQRRPERARHCMLCGHCVAVYDHHCVWIGRCVGEKNHAHFIVFCGVETLALAWGMVEAWAGLSPQPTLQAWLQHNAPYLFILAMCTLIVIGVGGLFTWHMYLAATGQTTYETFKYKSLPYYRGLPPYAYPYNWGVQRNLRDWYTASLVTPDTQLFPWRRHPDPKPVTGPLVRAYKACFETRPLGARPDPRLR